jgi:hypothetical protein
LGGTDLTVGVIYGSYFEVFGESFPGDVESTFDRAIAAERLGLSFPRRAWERER